MGCGTSRKNCNQKSCVQYYNTNVQELIAGESLTLAVGNRAVDTGVSIEAEPQAYVVVKNGLYTVSADIVIESTAAGNATVAVYRNGVVLPCTFRTVRVPATGDAEIHTETRFIVDDCCCKNIAETFTFVLISEDTAAGNIVQFCSGIYKLA